MQKVNINIAKIKNLKVTAVSMLAQSKEDISRFGYISKRTISHAKDTETIDFNPRVMLRFYVEARKNSDEFAVSYRMKIVTISNMWVKLFIRCMEHMINHINDDGLFTQTDYGFRLNTDIAAKYDIIDKVINNSVFSLRYTVAPVEDRTYTNKQYSPGVAFIVGDESNDVICELTIEEFIMLHDYLSSLNLVELALTCHKYVALTSENGGVRVNQNPIYEEITERDIDYKDINTIRQYLPSDDGSMEDTSLPL